MVFEKDFIDFKKKMQNTHNCKYCFNVQDINSNSFKLQNLKRLRLIKRQQLPIVSIVLHVQTKKMTSGSQNKM